VKGVSLNEISDSLHLSYKTVANYQSNIRQKLDVTSAAQLVRLAIDHGVISGE
jgi:two-component system invasion response regulator UvrY